LPEQRQNGLYVNVVFDMQGIRASARNNYTSCLSFGLSTALHPPAHILICTGGFALSKNQNPVQSCGIISCRDPNVLEIKK